MVDFRHEARRTATTNEAVLQDIVRRLVERLGPRRIILFGSRARGDARADSDYDVAVELEKTIDRPIDLMRDILAYFPGRRDWELNVFLRGVGEIERDADDPGTIDWDIVRQGRLLYAAEGVSRELQRPPAGADSPRAVRERPRRPPASVRKWVKRAADDLTAAEVLLERSGSARVAQPRGSVTRCPGDGRRPDRARCRLCIVDTVRDQRSIR
jgi:predicted nucleotidyltransferase